MTNRLKHLGVQALPLLVLGATAVIYFAHTQQVAELRAQVFGSLVDKAKQQVTTALDGLFTPTATNLAILARSLQAEMPDLKQAETLNYRVMPILEEVPQVSSAMVARGDGREYMVLRVENGWLTRLVEPGSPLSEARWQRWRGNEEAESWQEQVDYDPRRRPWFRGATDLNPMEAPFWTDPYRFFTTQELGITVSSKWTIPGGQGQFFVVAYDLLLTEISLLTQGLTADGPGKAFLLTAAGEVVGVPSDSTLTRPEELRQAVLTPAADFPVAIVKDAYQQWAAAGRQTGQVFRFQTGGSEWLADFWPFQLGNQTLWVALTAPETHVVQRAGGDNRTVSTLILGIGGLMFLISLWVLRRYGRILADQRRAPDRLDTVVERLNDMDADLPAMVASLMAQGESERVEFKSSVRWNFKAGRTGKEMELAWLKTVVAFLNSNGGVLLLGVDDDGNVLGLGKDGFANDDMALRHIENLVAQHIGSANFPSVRTRLMTVDDDKVLIIVCRPAPNPVFLKHDKGEDFYIRTGPASRALPPSEVLAYVESRKQTAIRAG